jgi:hypothetical protein
LPTAQWVRFVTGAAPPLAHFRIFALASIGFVSPSRFRGRTAISDLVETPRLAERPTLGPAVTSRVRERRRSAAIGNFREFSGIGVQSQLPGQLRRSHRIGHFRTFSDTGARSPFSASRLPPFGGRGEVAPSISSGALRFRDDKRAARRLARSESLEKPLEIFFARTIFPAPRAALSSRQTRSARLMVAHARGSPVFSMSDSLGDETGRRQLKTSYVPVSGPTATWLSTRPLWLSACEKKKHRIGHHSLLDNGSGRQ